MRKMIKGEMLIFGEYVSYEVMHLGNMKIRKILANVHYLNTSNSPSAKISADGTKAYLPSAASPYFVILDLATGLYLQGPDVLPGASCNCVDFSPDGLEMVLGFDDTGNGTPGINFYDAATMTLKPAPFSDLEYVVHINKVAYSPDGRWLAISGYGYPSLRVYDRTTFTQVPLPTNFNVINAYEFSPDSSKFVVCGSSTSNYKLVIFNTLDWQYQTPNTGSLQSITHLKFSPSGNRIGITTGLSVTPLAYFNIPSYAFVFPQGLDITAYAYAGGKMLHWLDENTTVFLGTESYDGFKCLFVYNWLTAALEINYVAMNGFVMMPGTTTRKLVGTVKDIAAAPVSRTIRVYDRATGEHIAEVPSTSGNFSIRVYSPDETIVMSVGQGTEMTEIFDRVVPVAYP